MDRIRKYQWGPFAVLLMAALFLGSQGLIFAQPEMERQPAQTPQFDQMQQPQTPSMEPRMGQSGQMAQGQILNAKDLVGMNVKNAQGEDIGKIEEIVVDTQQHRIAYGVLSFGGFLGMGDKYFAVPWTALKPQGLEAGKGAQDQTKPKYLVLNVDKEQLKKAPGFDKNNWPDMANPQWGAEAEKFYSQVSPAADQAADQSAQGQAHRDRAQRHLPPNYAKLSEIMKWDVYGTQGKIGTLKNVMVDMQHSHVVYAIIKPSDKLEGFGDKLAVIPWTAVTVDPQAKRIQTNAPADAIRAFAFNEDQMPNLSDRSYAQMLHQRFNAEPYWQAYGYSGDEGKMDSGRMPQKSPEIQQRPPVYQQPITPQREPVQRAPATDAD